TGYGVGNRCVDDVVDNYLVAGKNPRGRVNCG
ncbi:MAG: alpha/beta hydrolase, partial [Aeromicrobium sp.]